MGAVNTDSWQETWSQNRARYLDVKMLPREAVMKTEISSIMKSGNDDKKPIEQCIEAQLQSLAPSLADTAVYTQLRQEFDDAKGKDETDFARLLGFEKRLLDLYPDSLLKRKARFIRERFAVVAGAEGYRKYLTSAPPDPINAPREELLADLRALLDQIHASYAFNIDREQRVGKLKQWLVGVSALILAVGTLAILTTSQAGWLCWLIVASGILGALTSILRRLQDVATLPAFEKDPVLELTSLSHGRTGIYIALVSGAVFSLLLYCVFASGVIGNGGIFPEFKEVGGVASGGMDLAYFANHVGPAGYKDYGKVLVWSFISGFAERFVPDVLDRLIRRSEQAGAVSSSPKAV